MGVIRDGLFPGGRERQGCDMELTHVRLTRKEMEAGEGAEGGVHG